MSYDYYNSLPKKRMASAALILDDEGKVLIVKPTYKKDTWLLPGGAIESNESPLTACIREVFEETSLRIACTKLLFVQYSQECEDYTESVMFIFYGRIIDKDSLSEIKIPSSELENYAYVSVDDLPKYLNAKMHKRIMFSLEALKSGNAIYLEDQKRIF